MGDVHSIRWVMCFQGMNVGRGGRRMVEKVAVEGNSTLTLGWEGSWGQSDWRTPREVCSVVRAVG